MKFKFAPKGDYQPGQCIVVNGIEYVVEHLSASRHSMTVRTAAEPVERILVVLTDEPPIEEIPA